jgi:hypothetical protein
VTGVKSVTCEQKSDIFLVEYDPEKTGVKELEQTILKVALAKGARKMLSKVKN